MGYYTYYSLEVYDFKDGKKGKGNTSNVWDWLHTHDYETVNGSNCKWYEHDNDMRKLSIRFPDSLFILSGEGEESGDIWKKYYVNGGMQETRAALTFEDFDPDKLDVCSPNLLKEVQKVFKAEAIRSASLLEIKNETIYKVQHLNVTYRVVVQDDNISKVTREGSLTSIEDNPNLFDELIKIIEESKKE